MLSFGFESSGSSYTVAGDEYVNSSPSVMKNPVDNSVNNTRTASLYDVLEYEKRNISIPAKSDVSELLTPMKESLVGKSEFEIWMLRHDSSLANAKNDSGLEKLSEIIKEDSSVNLMSTENMENGGSRVADVTGEHSLVAAEKVTSGNVKSPNYSQPLDGESNLGSRLNASCVVGPAMESDSDNGPKITSPINKLDSI
ncbi:hypothetical protein Hanom_Chr00s002783g01704821 [Helianthus anomalus]